MESNVMDVNSNSSHVFITQDTFLGSPLESSFNRIFDFIQELNTLSDINKHVWSIGVWSEAPNLGGIGFIPLVLFDKNLTSFFGFYLWSNFFSFNIIRKFTSEWDSFAEKSVMLIW